MALQKSTLALLTLANQADLGALEAALAEWGVPAYRLDGRDIRDTATFWRAAGQQLPLPPGRREPASWSALSDSLWESLHEVESEELALLWTDAQAMLDGGLADLLAAVDVLTRLSRQFYSPSSPQATPKTLYVILAGMGPNFPRI